MVDRSSFSAVGSLFHARGSATEEAVSSPIRRRVRGTTRSPDDEARSADRAGTQWRGERYDCTSTRTGPHHAPAGTSATGVSKSEMQTACVCPRSYLWTIRHNLHWMLSATGSQCSSQTGRPGSRDRAASDPQQHVQRQCLL